MVSAMSHVGRTLSLDFEREGTSTQLSLVTFCASLNHNNHTYCPSQGGGWGPALMGFALFLLEFKLAEGKNSKDFTYPIPLARKSPLKTFAEELEKKSWIWLIFAKETDQKFGFQMVSAIFRPASGDHRHGKKGKPRKLRIRGSEMRRESVTIKFQNKRITDQPGLRRLVTAISKDWNEKFGSVSDTLCSTELWFMASRSGIPATRARCAQA